MSSAFTPKNPKYFYSIEEHPQLKVLEEKYAVILEELQQLRLNSKNGHWMNSFPHYVVPGSKNSWKTFTFQFFGIKHPLNCRACPNTTEILKSIPELITAEFSFLPPQTKIAPHTGFTKMVLRAHLGLIIPNDCGIRVGNETKKWEEGKVLILDDSFEHEAWNNSDEDRFVLMLDIPNPSWGFTAKEISKYKIENLQDEFMLKLFPREKWVTFLKKGEFDLPLAK
jgi:ornithine lipid ester-linked acyl 2-hydroxylase